MNVPRRHHLNVDTRNLNPNVLRDAFEFVLVMFEDGHYEESETSAVAGVFTDILEAYNDQLDMLAKNFLDCKVRFKNSQGEVQ